MRNVVFIIFCISFFSCKNENSYDSFQDYDLEQDTSTIGDQIIEETSKDVEWKDGNIYSYDYTETVNLTDSLGNNRVITIYKRYRPNEENIICEPKICKWCSKEVYSLDYSINEYPNFDYLSGKNITSVYGMVGLLLTGEHIHYIDLDNNMMRTEWNIECNYPGPDGFCSLKCESEYRYR
jgi:hypothetical protein